MRRAFTTNAKTIALQRQNERNDPYRDLSPAQLRAKASTLKPKLDDVVTRAIPSEYRCGSCGAPLDQNKQCRNSTADWPHS